MWIVPGLQQFRTRESMGIFHRPRPAVLSDTFLIAQVQASDQDAMLIRCHYGQQSFSLSLSLLFFFLLFSPLRQRAELAWRRETRACKKSNSPFRGEGRRGKLEGEKLRSFMSFFVKKCEGDECTARVFMRRIYRDRLCPTFLVRTFNLPRFKARFICCTGVKYI